MKARTLPELKAELIACRNRQIEAARRRDVIGMKQEHRHEQHIQNKIKELLIQEQKAKALQPWRDYSRIPGSDPFEEDER